ncbi:hypothetical protein GCM10007416_32190 [Kroppenstedtia guangzhouensis]|uniref:Uncharacterized protein n=1 Tax=Kroppenstedtia guangzhouensis TaxID=1274356 RepID=A0ABQ1H3L3_9BACL|nr:hypothetical protein GCM10007416_32190 [Kroppenstedtia guangzhouensis]
MKVESETVFHLILTRKDMEDLLVETKDIFKDSDVEEYPVLHSLRHLLLREFFD